MEAEDEYIYIQVALSVREETTLKRELKSLETKMGRESFSYEELKGIEKKGIDNYVK